MGGHAPMSPFLWLYASVYFYSNDYQNDSELKLELVSQNKNITGRQCGRSLVGVVAERRVAGLHHLWTRYALSPQNRNANDYMEEHWLVCAAQTVTPERRIYFADQPADLINADIELLCCDFQSAALLLSGVERPDSQFHLLTRLHTGHRIPAL